MAQKSAAERLLAPPAKVASARFSLALALAALLLCGCGGGSSSDTTTPSAAHSSQKAAGEDLATAPDEGGGAKGGKAGESAKQGAVAAGAPGKAAGGTQGKDHRSRIPVPKGAPEQAPTPAEIAHATVADMSLQSPAIVPSAGAPGSLASTYTCDGADNWPPLRWGGVPAGTSELILYAMSLQPVEGKLFVDGAVAGLDPSLEGIEAGKLPAGAIQGTNGFGRRGYELCPSGAAETYMFAIYALPRKLSPERGFDARELRKQILDVSGDVGLLPAVYARG